MKLKYLSIVALLLTTTIGCKKSFLNTEPTQFTTPELLGAAARQDPKLLNGSIAGLYTTMFSTGVGGTTGHDDFGQKGIDIYTDMLQSDMVLAGLNYGWYSNVARYNASPDFTRNEVYIPFRYYYRQIFGANNLIDILGGNDAVPAEAGNKYTMGQAKAMRAYSYFYLTQLYGKEYGTGNDKLIPIYTSATQVNRPKGTTKEVFDLMVKDLTDAISLLTGFTRSSKDQVDINVAKGLLAYVLSARGTTADLNQVVTLTQDIMNAYPKTTVAQLYFDGTNAATAGFNNVANPSWIWGVDLTLAQGLNLISWWGQVDQFTYSYTWAGDPKTIDRGLYDAIRADDIRKNQFVAPTATSRRLQPTGKFWAPARVSGGQRFVETDYVYMRADEFYLLNAEAKARLNQDAAAQTALKSFLTGRITDVSYVDALSGQSLLDEIYLQTRIELWGEGKAYLAMKRLKKPVVRGSNHLFEAGATIQYSDPKLTFVIPQAEVLNNPNLNN
ncbi:SusD-like starch-binding protein associating with outer membrane [Lacibacter cauensis]|uniref:SusD-like starch-binding protein associating with outer membrane n=1 Tax=Lacibacter cauensis TaxID=510947 RepID=A0A562SQK9_9BACT|nr:RagB/SusD family nutrient uptake outer membrane protein [Lacibacter cauensis]TWI83531.1 SusD-like starch-binding protein associating with outer membrane [Lacibacter cauensis]